MLSCCCQNVNMLQIWQHLGSCCSDFPWGMKMIAFKKGEWWPLRWPFCSPHPGSFSIRSSRLLISPGIKSYNLYAGRFVFFFCTTPGTSFNSDSILFGLIILNRKVCQREDKIGLKYRSSVVTVLIFVWEKTVNGVLGEDKKEKKMFGFWSSKSRQFKANFLTTRTL